MKTSWKICLAAMLAGGAVVYIRTHAPKNGTLPFEVDWPKQKNFGAFPPDIPQNVFDGVRFI
jgi:hypothetical protein